MIIPSWFFVEDDDSHDESSFYLRHNMGCIISRSSIADSSFDLLQGESPKAQRPRVTLDYIKVHVISIS